uniref:Transcription factor IIIC subunit 5 HTH domain-containing protein n=1 Tax=Ciona savignyi TaxID=51511 RepID=H2ZF74_CIOSA
MLQTLGGLENITQVYMDPSKRLDLRFRPGDPCSKPVCADSVQSTAVLLKTLKYRRKGSGKEEFRYRQSLCGIIATTYRFTTLCDYQYISVNRDKTTNNFMSMIPSLSVHKVDFEDKFFKQESSLFLPPPTFSRIDAVQEYNFKKEVASNKASTVISVTRPSRTHNAICVKFEDEVPSACVPEAMFTYKKHYGDDDEHLKEKLEQMFNERPIWSKNGLLAKLCLNISALKILLPTVAYYFVTGPWRSLWVKLGYDPRCNPESKIYQLLDFRLRRGINTPHIPIKAKRSAFHYKLPNLSLKPKSGGGVVCSLYRGEHEMPTTSQVKPNDSVYIYEPGVLPAYRQMFYQACDIKLPEVEHLVARKVGDAAKCSKKHGWFVQDTAQEARNAISKDIFKTISTMKYGCDAEEVESIWKSAHKSKSRSSNSKHMMFRDNSGTVEPGDTSSSVSDMKSESSSDEAADESDLFLEESMVDTATLLADIAKSTDV